MGDDGALYPAYDRRCCEKMKALAAAADIITPNLTELCILTGSDYQEMKNASYDEIARLARPFKKAVITGVHSGNMLVNLVIDGGDTRIIKVKNTGGRFSGTGDIFTAVLCGCLLRGKSLFEAAQTAADFILMSVAETVKAPYNPLYGINFEQQLSFLTEVSRNATE
jgi:pyridoxine kinase